MTFNFQLQRAKHIREQPLQEHSCRRGTKQDAAHRSHNLTYIRVTNLPEAVIGCEEGLEAIVCGRLCNLVKLIGVI
eukprot:scaffold149205_cov13-Tisochrysis_lutea.AAC.1